MGREFAEEITLGPCDANHTKRECFYRRSEVFARD